MRLLTVLVLLGALLGVTGCETVEKPADSMLPQAQPASWQGGLPGMQTPAAGFR
ncbi:MAG: hypothetical protein RLZZ412_182 [Verrucomicrobiota bacterium]|jgi:hypothetical protein